MCVCIHDALILFIDILSMLVEKDLLFIRFTSTEADVVVLYFSFIFNVCVTVCFSVSVCALACSRQQQGGGGGHDAGVVHVG